MENNEKMNEETKTNGIQQENNQNGTDSNNQTEDTNENAQKNDNKADKSTRIIAFLIDSLLSFAVGFIPVLGWVVSPIYWLLRDGLKFEFMDHRSIGKKIMKIRPVTLEGKKLEIQDSVKRNWMFAIGGLAGIPVVGWFVMLPIALIAIIVEVILVLTDKEGRRFGDKIANTKVIVEKEEKTE